MRSSMPPSGVPADEPIDNGMDNFDAYEYVARATESGWLLIERDGELLITPPLDDPDAMFVYTGFDPKYRDPILKVLAQLREPERAAPEEL